MAKLGIDKDSMKRFFSLHVEKIVLGVVVMLLVFFVYRGYSLGGLEKDKRPDLLKKKAVAVHEFIVNPAAAEEIVPAHQPKTGFVERTKAGQAPINYRVFEPRMPSPTKPLGEPRTDPELFAPMEVEAKALAFVGVAYAQMQGEVDPFQDDEDMTPKKAPEKKKKNKKKKKGKDSSYPGGDPYGAMGDEGGLSGLSGFAGAESDEESDEGMASMPGISGMSGIGGMGSMGVGGGGMVMANPADFEGFRPPPGAIVATKHVVGVTAIIPYRKQWDAYDATLANAMGYVPTRDVPTYLGFYAERAEVKDETDTDYKWVAISNSDFVIKRMTAGQRPYGGWAGYPQEVADPRYVSNILTMPIPPIVSKSYEDIARHSKIPKFQAMPEVPEAGETPELPEDSGTPDEIGSAPSLAGVGPRPGMGGKGEYGAGAMGAPGMGAPGMGAPGMGGMQGMSGYGGASGMAASEMGASGMGAGGMEGATGYGSAGMGSSGMGGMEGYGEMGAGMGGMGTPTFGPTVDHLMVRFFDLSVRDSTKKYRYRIQLWVEDPNHPKNPLADPNVRALHPTVRARITDIKAKEAAANSRLSYFRSTEFSEPSNVIAFERANQTLGGTIAMERESVISDEYGNQFEMPVAERSAKVLSVVWDVKRAIEVPGLVTAHRGTFLNFDLDADVVHPVTLSYKTIKEFRFRTNRMVLDFMGGEPLPVPKEEQEDEPLYSPGEFLFLNEKGELFVKNELDDWDGFKKRMPPEPMASGDTMDEPGMAPGMAPGMMPGGLGGEEGYPGGEDAGDRGRGGRSSRGGGT